MTVDRHALYDLVDELPDDQVPLAIADLRRRIPKAVEELNWPPKFFGAGLDKDGRTDLSERVDDYLAQGFGSPRS